MKEERTAIGAHLNGAAVTAVGRVVAVLGGHVDETVGNTVAANRGALGGALKAIAVVAAGNEVDRTVRLGNGGGGHGGGQNGEDGGELHFDGCGKRCFRKAEVDFIVGWLKC